METYCTNNKPVCHKKTISFLPLKVSDLTSRTIENHPLLFLLLFLMLWGRHHQFHQIWVLITTGLYCSGVGGFKNFDCCDKVQQRELRYYFGVHKRTTLSALEGDTGWINSKMRRILKMFRLWNRICIENDRLTRKVFECDFLKSSNPTADNWCKAIESLFSKINKIC